jgi:hypothetical protein
MHRTRALFICGSLNQTTQMHQIAEELSRDVECSFTTFYGNRVHEAAKRCGLTEATVMGYRLSARADAYLRRSQLAIDYRGRRGPYDLVVTCSDLIVPANVKQSLLVLVQEGMTDPEGPLYRLWRRVPIVPRWLLGTSASGLSHQYDLFCVASEGYRRHFLARGVPAERVVVTGIPNFDNCAQYLTNAFPHRHYVLVCTSDCRETFMAEDRAAFIRQAVSTATGRQLIFKLHPNEQVARATREIERYAPGALVFSEGSAEEMIANCDVLITRYSSTAFVGLALGKEVHSDFDVETLRDLLPIQTGVAARTIADECRRVLAARREHAFGTAELEVARPHPWFTRPRPDSEEVVR